MARYAAGAHALKDAGEPNLVLDRALVVRVRFWPLLAKAPNRVITSGRQLLLDMPANSDSRSRLKIVKVVKTSRLSAFDIRIWVIIRLGQQVSCNCADPFTLPTPNTGIWQLLHELCRVHRDTLIHFPLGRLATTKAWKRKRLEARAPLGAIVQRTRIRFLVNRDTIESE